MAMSLIQLLAPAANALIPDITAFMVHSTVLAIGAFAVVWLLRHRSMVTQSLVLKTFMLLILLCPGLMYLLRGADVMLLSVSVPVERTRIEPAQAPLLDRYMDRLLTEQQSAETVHPGIPAVHERVAARPEQQSLISGKIVSEPVAAVSAIPGWRTYAYVALSLAWIAMAVFFAFRLLYGFVVIMFIRVTAHAAEVSAYRFGHLAAQRYHVSLPRLLRSRYIRSPLLAGVFRPVIILPETGDVSPEIIAHELSHYMHGDCFWKLIGQLAHIVIPLQPLVHMLNHRMEDISDYISDDFVVESKFDPRQYAVALVKYAEYASSLNRSLNPAVQFMSARSGLKSRVERILSTSARRSLVNGRAAVLSVGTVGLALALSIAAVSFEATAIALPDPFVYIAVSSETVRESIPEQTSEVTPQTLIRIQSEPIETETMSASIAVPTGSGQAQAGLLAGAASKSDQSKAPDRTEVGMTTAQPSDRMAGAATEMLAQPDREPSSIPETGFLAMLTYPEFETRSISETIEPDPVRIEDLTDSVSSHTPAVEENVMESDIAYLVKQQSPIINETTFDVTALHTYQECMEIGAEMFDSGRYFLALKLFKRAGGFRPGDATANFNIGRTYYKTADLQNAKMFLQMAIAQNPEYDLAHLRLGDTIRDMGDLDAAWNQYKIAFDLNPALAKEKKEIF